MTDKEHIAEDLGDEIDSRTRAVAQSRCPVTKQQEMDLRALAKVSGREYCEQMSIAIDEHINRQKIKSDCKTGTFLLPLLVQYPESLVPLSHGCEHPYPTTK